MISSLGLYLMYQSGLGSTPLATISDGISSLFLISRGTANIVANSLLLIFALLLNRKGIGKGTFIAVFGIGAAINMWTYLLGTINPPVDLWRQIVFSFIGLLMNSFGLSYYVKVSSGFGPLEYITEIFVEKSGKKYRTVKSFIDVVLLMIGIGLGGVFGLGTIINVCLTGIIMNFFIENIGRK